MNNNILEHESCTYSHLLLSLYCLLDYIISKERLGSTSKDDHIKLSNNKNKTSTKTGNKGISKLVSHFDTLDQGTEAFMQWLGSEDKTSALNNPIILKQFVDNKYTILYDNTLSHDVIVETHEGVPFCKSCNTDDCGHVGFTILLEQKYENDGTILE
jgi:hypothetical protein